MPIFDYANRTAEQTLEAMRTALPIELPEVAVGDLSDPFWRAFAVFAAMMEQVHYYVDNAALNSFLETAELFAPMIALARGNDYRVRGLVPCQAVLTFSLSAPAPSDVLIPQYTIVETAEGISYTTIADVTIATGETTANITAIQQTRYVGQVLGTTTGEARQVLLISDKLSDGSAVLTIGAETYAPVQTFFYSAPNDTHFIQSMNADGVNELMLGDGINGKLPAVGQTVYADYALTLGAAGKALANTITEIVSSVSVPPSFILSCTNLLDASGGRNRPTVEEIRRGVRATVMTTDIAVSRETYTALGYRIPGVEKVGIFYETGSTVYVYVLPAGGGVATPALLAEVEAFYNARRIILTRVKASSAGEVRVLLTLRVALAPNAVRALVLQKIRTALTEFGGIAQQDITGRMYSGKIDQLAYNVEGVESNIIEKFSLVPYARPMNSSNALHWEVEMLEGCADTTRWRIEFYSAVSFRLFRQDTFLGNFDVNEEVTHANEIRFTVLQSYANGSVWEFYTYPYLGRQAGAYQLTEPSILRINETDINIILTGGI